MSKDYLENLKQKLGIINSGAMKNYYRNTDRIMQNYNKKMTRHTWSFKERDFVWIYHHAKAKSVGKVRHKWRGPYEIIEDCGYGNYKARDC